MDFLDFAKAGELASGTIVRLYIASTVTMAIAVVTATRGIRQVRDYPYPLTIVFFTAVNGLIFRAISLSELINWDDQRSTLLTSYDYPRMLFFTISNLTLHLIPIVTLHRWLGRKNRSLTDDGLSGIFSMVSYFMTFVIFVLVICLMGVGSTIPWNQEIMNSIIFNSDTSSNNLGLLPVFSNLMDASNMLYWWYTLSYIVILAKHVIDFHWSFLVFCILLIATQIVLTVSTFLPQISSVPSGVQIEIILQFIFVLQFSFIGLMIAIFKGSTWVPPPVEYFADEELHDINNN
ncbi:hypothetical protein BCR42DRAFT_420728 [Absidia repens]|uniref:Uncharacterized protein n=1 Tax=Absidia repens TaxID=90262 RepID=A0A1X2I8Y8_9FUNG|nr:hypothetical protein BCR42DRAFT_420728 [Absidia repens]